MGERSYAFEVKREAANKKGKHPIRWAIGADCRCCKGTVSLNNNWTLGYAKTWIWGAKGGFKVTQWMSLPLAKILSGAMGKKAATGEKAGTDDHGLLLESGGEDKSKGMGGFAALKEGMAFGTKLYFGGGGGLVGH